MRLFWCARAMRGSWQRASTASVPRCSPSFEGMVAVWALTPAAGLRQGGIRLFRTVSVREQMANFCAVGGAHADR